MKYVENCHEMAQMAGIAYLDGKEAAKEFKKLGYGKHKFFERDGAQCHAVWNERRYVLCFRGTEPDELSDVLADLNAFPDKGIMGGYVHNGFQNEVEKLWPDLKAHYEKNGAKKEFFITGHSLGGAMSTIAASRFSDNVDCLYTYGSPRVGTRGFIKTIKCPHYRHVNNNDIVTSVPPALMLYRHHGTLRYINFYGYIRKLTFWQKVKDKFRGYRSGILDGAMDHGMNNYVEFTGRKENA
jgi:triacylglycerol lipase